MASQNPCTNFVSDMQKEMDKVKTLVKAPQVLIHHMQRLARKLTSDVMSDFTNNISSKLNSITSGLPNFSPTISDVTSALNKLNGCITLVPEGGNVLGHTLDIAISTLNKCNKYANAPSFVHNLVNQYIRDNALSQVNALLNNNVFGQISKLSNAYSKFLSASGITDSLNKMDGLIGCVSKLCGAYSDVKEAASEFTSEMNELQDKYKWDDNFSISNAADKVIDNVDSTTKNFIKSSGAYVESKYQTITEFKWEIF